MKKFLLLFIVVICSSFLSKAFGQSIHFEGCVNVGLSDSGYTLNPDGSITDDGITRTTYESAPNSQGYFEVIIIRWNATLDRWEIFHNADDPDNETANELLYFSSVATFPNPPNIAIGNWTNDFEEYACDPLDASHGELSGDVADTPPGINVDPTLTGLPAEVTVEEDALTDVFDISSVMINDIDAESGDLTLTLIAEGGIFDIAAGVGVTISGHLTSHLELTGNLTDLNHYIDILTNIYFRPNSNLNGNNAASVDVYINDNGNTGTGGGNDIFVGTIAIHITPVNDAPEVTVPVAISVVANSDSPLTGISIIDVDAESGNMNVNFSIAQGTLSAIAGGGVNITGSGTNNLELIGTLQNINSFIANSNITFQNELGNSDDQALTVSAEDNGNTGGGSLTGSAMTTVTVTAQPAEVNSVSVPENKTYVEGENLEFVVNFDKDVDVDTTTGTPNLLLTLGSSAQNANYISGSGTASLLFRYTIINGDLDTDGVDVNTLSLNGGIITNEGVDSNITLRNIGNTDNVLVDGVAPSGYTVTIDQDPIEASNESEVSFTFTGAEVGANFNYTFSSSGGGTNVSGSGTIISTTDQIAGIDLSGLEGGTVTLSVDLVDDAGNTGNPVTATAVKKINQAPTASGVEINGSPIIGEQLTGTYTFLDTDGDVESGSTYIWYRSDDSSGSGKSEISGAVSTVYTVQESDLGKFISFEVTPNDGTATGTAVESPLLEPVKLIQNITFPSISEKTYGDLVFTLGDAQTDQGLTVLYSAADPTLVEITGNQATVLKTGTTTITATQDGDTQVAAATPVQQTLVIQNATVTISAEDSSKIYGDADPTFTVNYSGFVNGDDETSLEGTLIITRQQGESVGNYSITPSGYTSDRYNISYRDGNFEIQQRMLTINAELDQHKIYGQDEPQLGYSVTGFVNGDDQSMMVGNLSREPGEDAGLYAISIGTLSAGNNYGLQLEDSEFEILKADQEIVWNQELSFGCSSESQVALIAESSFGLPVTYTVADPSIGVIQGNTFTFLQSGVTHIIAQQSGDQNHNPAPTVERTVTVSQKGQIRQHWDDVLVFDNSGGNFVSYQWYKNGAAINGATKQYYSEGQTLNGNYYVVATTDDGAQMTSCSLELSGESVSKTLMVIPNPVRATTEVAVKASFAQTALDGAMISIIDLNGRVVQTIPAAGEQTMITAPSQTGIYVILLNLSDGTRKTVNLLVQ